MTQNLECRCNICGESFTVNAFLADCGRDSICPFCWQERWAITNYNTRRASSVAAVTNANRFTRSN
jgi:hypothetical protein